MTWNRSGIIQKLRALHKADKPISYSQLATKYQSLLSAAAYHFGSYRKALEKAGIDYADILQRPRWTKQRIITLIKQAKRKGYDLHWGAVTQRNDELSRAAFACLQPRLFGKWDRALHAAGLDSDDVARYRTWDKNTVIFEIRARVQAGESCNSGALQKDDPSLHAAAVRYFKNHDLALRAAKLNPGKHRQRRRWTKSDVTQALKRAARKDDSLSLAAIRRQHTSLYGAAIRLFGSISAAKKAARKK
jgi:hypothetical protein